ncbi:MAG: hypothetical protein ACM3Q2_07845, partial [Syntrophothermus sp.]
MKHLKTILLFLLVFFFSPFYAQEGNQDTSLINTAHLEHLYEKIAASGSQMGIIHIYADAPDYKWTEAPGEGIACVDDAARAAIFYLRYHAAVNDSVSLDRVKSLLEFLFYMQDENGMFYNFILQGNSINRTRDNSKPKADWWTWRAMWAVAEAYQFFKGKDSTLENKLSESFLKILPAVNEITAKYPQTKIVNGIKVPEWLPYGCASDQAAVILMALAEYSKSADDANVKKQMKVIADGITMMQAGDSLKFPYGAHLSWENIWHAWGSNQAEALLKAGEILKDAGLIKNALAEINNFYRYLIKEKYFSEFSVKDGRMENIKKYPQIAYGINPLVSACIQAHRITRDTKYAEMAADIASWFFGRN